MTVYDPPYVGLAHRSIRNPGFTGPPPVNTAVPTITGTAQQGQTLTSSTGTWTNSPTGYTYQWQTSPNGTTGWTSIGGATASTYVPQAGDVGNYLRVQVVAFNGGGSGAAASSAATAQIAAALAAPVNSAVPTITGTAQQGNTLTSSTGTWTNSPTGYTYQWQTSANGTTGWTNLSATASTYVIQATDVNNYLRVQVTATNAGGSSSPASSAATAQVSAGTLPYNNTVLADTPVSFWPLNETTGTAAADIATGGNPGTYSGTGITLGQAGIGDGQTSVLFTAASGGFVNVPDAANLKPALLSMECWVNVATAVPSQTLISKWSSNGYIFLTGGGVVNMYLNGANINATLPIGAFAHVVGTYDGTNARLYINGVLVAGPQALALTHVTAPFAIGQESGSAPYLDGKAAKVAIYNYALTPAQVAAHYAAA